MLTIDATDPKSGTAEFKATVIRMERMGVLALPEDFGAIRRRRHGPNIRRAVAIWASLTVNAGCIRTLDFAGRPNASSQTNRA